MTHFYATQPKICQPIIPDESGGKATAPAEPAAPTEPNVIQRGMQGFYDSMDATRAAMNYQPMMVTPGSYNAMMLDPSGFSMGYERVSAPNMDAAQTSQADIDRFYNPYTDQVVDTSLADIDRARQMQANQARHKLKPQERWWL